jgi:iron(III) transport system ATP-binding protein
MLMDEPFTGLDVQLREAIQEETLGLLRETRATSMIVTHSPEEAMHLGDRIAVMRAGRLVQEGRAEDLYHRPAGLFVARLFSEINEITCRVESGSVTTPLGRVPAPGIADGEQAVLCVRERAIRLSGNGEGFSGRILHAKFLGDAALLELGVEGFDAPLRVRLSEGHGLGKGAEVKVTIDKTGILVFPASSGTLEG